MTSPSPFAAPASAQGLDYQALLGALLIIEVLTQEHDVSTTYGLKDPIRANITVVDGDHAGTIYEDTLLFPTALVSQLRPNIGSKVLGRLTQGEAKPGQKPPWLLASPSDDDTKTAIEFMNKNTFAAPQPASGQQDAQPPF